MIFLYLYDYIQQNVFIRIDSVFIRIDSVSGGRRGLSLYMPS